MNSEPNVRHLTPGDLAPDFTLLAADNREVSLANLRGSHVIVYFYPKQNTPGCTMQACDFRDNLNSLRAAGYTVLGVSPDPVADLAGFAADFDVNYDLLSDTDLAVTQAYGAWGEKGPSDNRVTGLIRATFVVNPDGVLTHCAYDVHAAGHVAALRRELGIDA